MVMMKMGRGIVKSTRMINSENWARHIAANAFGVYIERGEKNTIEVNFFDNSYIEKYLSNQLGFSSQEIAVVASRIALFGQWLAVEYGASFSQAVSDFIYTEICFANTHKLDVKLRELFKRIQERDFADFTFDDIIETTIGYPEQNRFPTDILPLSLREMYDEKFKTKLSASPSIEFSADPDEF